MAFLTSSNLGQETGCLSPCLRMTINGTHLAMEPNFGRGALLSQGKIHQRQLHSQKLWNQPILLGGEIGRASSTCQNGRQALKRTKLQSSLDWSDNNALEKKDDVTLIIFLSPILSQGLSLSLLLAGLCISHRSHWDRITILPPALSWYGIQTLFAHLWRRNFNLNT